MAANIGELVGEAATLETAGESFALPPDIWQIAHEHQEAARSSSRTEELFEDCFSVTPISECAYITGKDLSYLCDIDGLRSSNAHRGAIMSRFGFRKERPYLNGKQQTVWFRGRPGLPRSIERDAVRYVPSRDSNNRACVVIRSGGAPPIAPP